MFKRKKFYKFSSRRLNSACLSSLYLTTVLFLFIHKSIFSTQDFIFIFVCFSVSMILDYFIFSSTTEIDVKTLRMNNSIDEVAAELYKNDMIMHNKIGEYYVFKYTNFWLKNTNVFVKAHNKHCVILLPSKDAVWLEESLKKQ